MAECGASDSYSGLTVEKPLSTTMDGAEKLLGLHKKYERAKMMVAENYRYNEENNIIRDIIKHGRIGDPVYFIHNKVVDFEKIERDP